MAIHAVCSQHGDTLPMIAAGTGNVDVLCYIVNIDPYLVAVENKVSA